MSWGILSVLSGDSCGYWSERRGVLLVQVNAQASMSMSLAQTRYCRQQGFDPQSPLCAHIILSGSVMEVRTCTHTYTHTQVSSHMTHGSHALSGERNGGGVCEERSVQPPPGDDRLAVRPQLVLCQVQCHPGTRAASVLPPLCTSTASTSFYCKLTHFPSSCCWFWFS